MAHALLGGSRCALVPVPRRMGLKVDPGLPLGSYNIAQGFNIPLIVQPQMFAALCGVSWAQCMHYSHVGPFQSGLTGT